MAGSHPVLLATAAALVGTGCSLFGHGEGAAPIQVEIAAADRLNPDEHGDSLPTAVLIYQLKSAARMQGAEFEQLYRNAKETLGPDLLQVEEVTVSPGEKLRRRVERDRSATVLALVAVFRRPVGLSWRTLADLPPPGKSADFRVLVEGYRIGPR